MSSSPPKARGRPRSAESEQAILRVTLAILSTEGYGALSLDRVATEARASKSTIYRRWPTKEHLVMAVVSQMPMTEPRDCGSLAADLIDMFGQYGKILQHSPMKAVMPMLAAECVSTPSLSKALILINDRRRVPMRTILARAMARAELPADTDVELTIDVLQGAVATRLYFLLDPLTEEWIRKLVRLVCVGIQPPERNLVTKAKPSRRVSRSRA